MISSQAQVLIDRAEESHQAAKVLLDQGFPNFSAAQSYYTIFYLTEALLYSKDMQFSSHSAVIAALAGNLQRQGFSTQNSIAVSSLRRDDVKQAIMEKKTQ